MSNDINSIRTIDGCHGATNTITGDDFYNTVADTCAQITDVLEDHCGPYATAALIIKDNTGSSLKDQHYAIFTNDGINIVRSIEFVSPVQKHVRDMIAYIGSRVDALSHDGTTTAMLFFTLLVENYFTMFIEDGKKGALSKKKLSQDILTVINKVASEFESEMVLTVSKLVESKGITHLEAIRFIAYHQSMISSKGDKELTDAIVEVVETLPKELYGMFSVSQSGMETDKRFTVVRDDFDFVLPVVANIDDMNHLMNSEYLAESCDLLLSEDDIISGNPTIDIIKQYISNGVVDCDLVIIAKSIDATLQGIISYFNRTSKFKIIPFPMSLYNPYSSKITILSALMNTASVYPVAEHIIDKTLPYLIRGARVHYKKNRRVYISNLYKKDGSQYHPSFTDTKRFPPYTVMVNEIKSVIDDYNSGRVRVETDKDRARLTDYVEIYRRMISADVRNLQLSGMRHDTMADNDVLQDAFGAVLSSIDRGFVFDGYLKLFCILSRDKWKNNNIAAAIKDVVYDILSFVHKLHASDDDDNSRFDQQLGIAVNGNARLDITNIYYPVDATIQQTSAHHFKQACSSDIVIQPADTYRELFRRIIDLLPKLLNTNRVIIPGTVNTGETK